MKNYFMNLPASRIILWCFLIWYLCIVAQYFSASLELWLNSFGLSVIVGYALLLSTGPVTLTRLRTRFWESLRLFICPFLVSSFSAQVKGKGFLLLAAPSFCENLAGIIACALFVGGICALRFSSSKKALAGAK
jgi:hypothetical protein